jgi:hypothetical protein
VFATLLGSLPRPPLPGDAAPEAVLDAVLALQVEAGLEPVTDGGWPLQPGDPLEAWLGTAGRTDRLVKAVLEGPYTSGREPGALRATLEGLAEAGCAWIEIHESAAVSIGADPDARARFADAHHRLTDGLADVHLSLAITGGSADTAGIETVLAGAYASLAVDLIGGPDNWRLVAATPGDRGVICGALSTAVDGDDGPEVLLWAVGYAASTQGRGAARVGLATAGSLAHLPWDVASTRIEQLGAASRLATESPETIRAAIDPRAVDSRSAALGRYEPGRRRRRPARPVDPGYEPPT